MTKRLTRLMLALLVVIATMAWVQCVSAAIVVNSEGLQLGSGGMSAPVCPMDVQSLRFDRDQGPMPILDGLLTQGGASAPPTTSSVTAVNAVAAVFDAVHVPPTQLVARFLAEPCVMFPDPPLLELLDVPRCAHLAA